jgi:uncharacterized protein (DUF1800 family)
MLAIKHHWRAALLAGLFLAAGGQDAAAQAQPAKPSTEELRALHLLRRATFGVRPEDVQEVLRMGREGWLDRQLQPGRIDDSALQAKLGVFEALDKPMAELAEEFPPPQQLRRQIARMDSMAGGRVRPDSLPPRDQLTPEQRQMLQQRSPQRILGDLVGAKLTRAVYSERQLEEMMTDFWFNHFNVWFGKNNPPVRYMIADYEAKAIRPHVFGKFEDMVLATAKHPAMLAYLDNYRSVVPDSLRTMDNQRLQLAQRVMQMTDQQKQRLVDQGRITRGELEELERMQMNMPQFQQRLQGQGLNENYARELMELHTLGVDGGYTQKDVIEVARAFTGWTFVPLGQGQRQGQRLVPPGRPLPTGLGARRGMTPRVMMPQRIAKPGEFVFNEFGHDRGDKTILGRRFPANRGIEDGEDVIHMLVRHPSTAKFIATKLVERFVSDTPDPAFVNELAQVFTRTEGDLRAVTRALFTSPRFYDEKVIGTKVKMPFEVVASALRVTHAELGVAPQGRRGGAGQRVGQPAAGLQVTLRTLGQLPYSEPTPTGYPAAKEDWVNSGGLLNRMNFALELAAGRTNGVRIDVAKLFGSDRPDAAGALPAMLANVIPGVNTKKLEDGIREDLTRPENANAAPRVRAARAIGLALGSPEFQKR